MAVKFNDIVKAINGAIEDFNQGVPATQKSMLNAILVELKNLDLDSAGNIKTSVQNLKVIGKIKGDLNNLVVTDRYLTDVQGFVDSIISVSQLQNDYWQSIESTFSPGPLLNEIKSQAITDTVNVLTENGIAANISDALQAIMQTSVSSGGSYADLTDQLRTALTDQEGNPGLLSKYARTYTTDALNTFAAQYNQTISDDLGYEWFAYQGSDIETTRPFCDAMTDFTFFSRDEIPSLLAAENLYYTNKKTGKRELVPIYPKTGLPQGMKAETTPANFQTLRGGWNCGHQIRPVPASAVPTYIKNRDQIPGIMAKAKEGGPQLDELGNKYAKEYGGTVTPLNYKSYDSITRKTRDELGGDYKQIKDSVRNTVVVAYDKLDAIAAELKTKPEFIRVKVQQGPEYFGYKGIITNVKLKNGTIAEMQVNSPGMIYAKVSKKDALNVMSEAEYNKIAEITGLPGGLGHEYYDIIRELKPKIDDGTATAADLATYNNTIKKSEEYYSHFYEIKEAPVAAEKSLMTVDEAAKAMRNYQPTPNEIKAVEDYTNSSYGNINLRLRNGKPMATTEQEQTVKDLTSFLENAPKVNAISYRGLAFSTEERYNKFLDFVKNNNSITDKGFMSTSFKESVKNTFTVAPYRVIVEVQGKNGVYIQDFSSNKREQEILFNAGSEFDIVSYKETQTSPQESIVFRVPTGEKELYLVLKER